MLKRILTVLLLVSILPLASILAQTAEPGGLIVRSVPEGAEVVVKGDATVAGVTPTFFQQQLIGEFKVEVKKYGYEKYKTKILLDPSRQMELDVILSPKTRFKSAIRSMFIPGWGQRYADQKTKGFMFHLLFAGSLAGYLIADNDFDHKFDHYEEKLTEFDQAVAGGASRDELDRILSELNRAQQRAFDAEDTRRISIGIVAGVWGLNLLDALFFFPEGAGTMSIKGIGVKPEADLQSVGVTLSYGF